MSRHDSPRQPLRLAFVGDVGLCLRVPELLRRAVSAEEPPSFIRRLRSADLSFGNLEAALHDDPSKFPNVRTLGHTGDAPLLRELGLDVVTLANNHVLDVGPEGLELTRRTLDDLGIRHFGAGQDLDHALQPLVMEVHGWRIGFVGFVEGRPVTHKYAARRNAPGAAYLDAGLIRNAVTELRSRVDLVVVSFHQGVNYVHYASPRQREFVREAVDAGAHLVIGHHPHVLQGWHRWPRGDGSGEAPVFYSLGEFLWDPQVGDVVEPRWDAARRKTAILEITVEDAASAAPSFGVRIIPYQRTEAFELQELEGSEAEAFHAWWKDISDVYENYDPKIYLEAAGQGVVQHTLKVLKYNLLRGNVKFLLGSASRLRGRHLAIAWAHLRRRLFGASR